jgi:uncharacterized protein (DUF58 family)
MIIIWILRALIFVLGIIAIVCIRATILKQDLSLGLAAAAALFLFILFTIYYAKLPRGAKAVQRNFVRKWIKETKKRGRTKKGEKETERLEKKREKIHKKTFEKRKKIESKSKGR